jgi:hypothetical protein
LEELQYWRDLEELQYWKDLEELESLKHSSMLPKQKVTPVKFNFEPKVRIIISTTPRLAEWPAASLEYMLNLTLSQRKRVPAKMNASTAATPQTPAAPPLTQEPGALPPPHVFDVVPPLHAMLSRILLPSPGLLHPPGGESASADANKVPIVDDQGASGGNSSGSGPLDIQQLDSASNDIRVRIQKARTVVHALPDIDMTIHQQKAEIADLKDRIARMMGMLDDLKAQAEQSAPADSQ